VSCFIHWFRRDLRLDDNTALAAALRQASVVVPVFVLDPAILERPDTGRPRLAFLLACLRALDEQLRRHGSGLVLLAGDPVVELARLVRRLDAHGLTFNRDYEPYARQRDTAVHATLPALGCRVEDYPDQLLTEPEMLLSADGRPLTIFAHFRRRALARLAAAPPAPQSTEGLLGRLAPAATLPPSQPWPAPPALAGLRLPPPGEAAAHARLAAFASGPIWRYAVDRDRPALDGTARLSPYLKFGVISIRRCFQAAWTRHTHEAGTGAITGPAAWLNELLWRDFYTHILAHFPRVETGPFRSAFATVAWSDRPDHFAAWQAGRTGYPIVDAGMRQLLAEGWMPNRLRMITASFLCKDLLIDWRAGERHFMQWLVDGDLAANNGGWQWVAATGADSQPFFRIFHPLRQGQRYDPDGAYVRRFVPELARVPDAFIHAPHTLPPDVQRHAGCRIGVDYPAPIVDHETQRQRALQFYRRMTAQPAASADQPST
jgi:deoxyribodipyrimidine photo-lyase